MRKGFTLVELSIVLVIIGLLIGGILSAQSMIGTSKVQAQVRQFGQFDAAVASFYAKYVSIPGDSPSFPLDSGNGEGVGYLDVFTHCCNYSGGTNFYREVAYFWVHLNQTGFTQDGATFSPTITGGVSNSSTTARNVPRAAIDSKTGVIAGSALYNSGNWNSGTDNITFYGLADFSPVLDATYYPAHVAKATITGTQAVALDTKIDDGNAMTGAVRSTSTGGGGGSGSPTGDVGAPWDGFGSAPPAGTCASGTGVYVRSNVKACIPIVQIMQSAGGIPERATLY